MRIVVINLPYRTDRRRSAENELRRIGWRADFFPAIRPPDKGRFPSIGARGCFESHLQVIKSSIGTDRLLILEDDISFVRLFSARWLHIETQLLANQWHFFYGGYHEMDGLKEGFNEIPFERPVQGAHFLMLNGSILPSLLNFLTNVVSPMHVDGAYTTFRRSNPHICTVAINPPIAYQRPSRSDIAPIKWIDRVPMVRNAATLARRLKTALS